MAGTASDPDPDVTKSWANSVWRSAVHLSVPRVQHGTADGWTLVPLLYSGIVWGLSRHRLFSPEKMKPVLKVLKAGGYKLTERAAQQVLL